MEAERRRIPIAIERHDTIYRGLAAAGKLYEFRVAFQYKNKHEELV